MTLEPTTVNVTDDVENFVKDIIVKNKLDPTSNIVYNVGSESGDGYLSRNIAVDIDNGLEKIHIFLKCGITTKDVNFLSMDKVFENEMYFYNVIYPTCLKFAEEKGFEDSLNIVPKFYGSSNKNIIALENLKVKGFELFERTDFMNESHLLMVLKAFAKYHAVSLALKDQNAKEYEKLADNIHILLDFKDEASNTADFLKYLVNNFLSKLDSVKDRYMLEKCGNVWKKFMDYITNIMDAQDQYTIITKGDCWSNNTMFKYKDENRKRPSEVMLIDWQIIKYGSLVLDLSYAFYSMASKEELDKFEFYLQSYHQELEKCIGQLGSDPAVVYPYSVFEKEWKTHCIYGYIMAFSLLKVMLVAKEDVVSLEDASFDDYQKGFAKPMKSDEEYMRRLKNLTQHMIDKDFL